MIELTQVNTVTATQAADTLVLLRTNADGSVSVIKLDATKLAMLDASGNVAIGPNTTISHDSNGGLVLNCSNVTLNFIPSTSDPLQPGQLWNNGGYLCISGGP